MNCDYFAEQLWPTLLCNGDVLFPLRYGPNTLIPCRQASASKVSSAHVYLFVLFEYFVSLPLDVLLLSRACYCFCFIWLCFFVPSSVSVSLLFFPFLLGFFLSLLLYISLPFCLFLHAMLLAYFIMIFLVFYFLFRFAYFVLHVLLSLFLYIPICVSRFC
jgi:hypothetical protein